MRKGKVLVLLAVCIVSALLVVLLKSKAQNEGPLDENQIKPRASAPPKGREPGYNIILITVDTLRADHLGCYGYEKNTSPHIDAFAQDSIVFENAYSQGPSTVPALRAMMTGRVISNEDKNDIVSYYHDATFLAEVLSKKGYLTAGFTDHRGLGGTNEKGVFRARPRLGFHKGFDSFKNFGKGRTGVTSHILTESALSWLSGNHEDKFFLWIHYFDPHFNYSPLPDYEGLFGFSVGDRRRIFNGIDIKEIRKIENDLSQKEVDALLSLYDSEIFYTDEHIGKVLHKVKDLGLQSSTVIVISADHGEEFKERTRIGHQRTVYNELIHVPLIIKMPNQAPRRIKENIATRKLFDILSNVDSDEATEFSDDDVISRTYHHRGKQAEAEPDDFTIVSRNYNYVYNPGTGNEELYDLDHDLAEKNNLVDKSSYGPKRSELKAKLMVWISKNSVKSRAPSKEALQDEKELNKRLRSLGYVR